MFARKSSKNKATEAEDEMIDSYPNLFLMFKIRSF